MESLKEPANLSTARTRRKKTIFLMSFLSALAAFFMLLSFIISKSDYTPVDLRITQFIQSVDSPALAAAMELVSWPGYIPQSVVFTALAALLLLGLGLRWEALASVAAACIEEALNLAVKAIIHRPRPSASLIHVFATLKSYSFPSGHVMFYTCFFGFMWYLSYTLLKPSRKRAALLLSFGIPVLAVGFSRIYLGEHWATDVLGAYLAGGIALILSIQLYRWGKNRNLVRQPKARGRTN